MSESNSSERKEAETIQLRQDLDVFNAQSEDVKQFIRALLELEDQNMHLQQPHGMGEKIVEIIDQQMLKKKVSG